MIEQGILDSGGDGVSESEVRKNYNYTNVTTTSTFYPEVGKWYSFDVAAGVTLTIQKPLGNTGDAIRYYFYSIDDTAVINVLPAGTDTVEGGATLAIPEYLEKSAIEFIYNGPDGSESDVNINWEIPKNKLPIAELEQAEYDALGTYQDWISYITPEVTLITGFTEDQLAVYDNDTEQFRPANEDDLDNAEVIKYRTLSASYDGVSPYTEITGSGSGNFQKVTNATNDLFTVNKVNGINFVGDEIVIQRDGQYLIMIDLSTRTGGNNSDIELKVIKNSVQIGGRVHLSKSNAIAQGNMSMTVAPDCLAGDHIWFEIADVVEPADATVMSGNINAMRIGING